ncbi:Rpn family recombination-promoting nuclease/putative transposase [Candidatus Cyanaurora vandensis]|uniref:Rpn family recombination-promoting nuclease/putative transposase n=1 Tax=Candidatus Cyanaurora vandensis TaxID=2714958 RepID=UPI00257CA13D|nr:Rpn family recombination-promoting nuclease/putative transposase [Candidatus Cyanaurora vandensis]
MQTDTLLNEIFRRYPYLLLELWGEPTNTTYRFEAQEVKQAAFRFDGLLLPEQPDQPLYFLECQFQRDEQFYHRFFAEIAVYLRQQPYPGDCRAVVLFVEPSVDPGVPLFYQSFEQTGRLYRLYLKSMQERPGSLPLNILQLLVVPESEMQQRMAQVVERVQTEVAAALEQEQLLNLVGTLLVYKFPNRERRELEMAFGFTELSKTRVYQEAKEEGRVEGKQEGKLEAVPALLARGFSVAETAQILGLSVVQVQSAQTLPG